MLVLVIAILGPLVVALAWRAVFVHDDGAPALPAESTGLAPPVSLDFAALNASIDALSAERAAEVAAIVESADVRALADAAAAGRVGARELVAFHLSRIRAHDAALHSVVRLNPAAFGAADALDALAASGGRAGSLHGVPVLVKDNIATGDGMPVTVGAAALADHRSPVDAPVVRRLREAGAIVLGKTNLSEWAYFMSSDAPSGYSAVGGQSVNPWGADLEVLGSSSGSAVAAAMGFAPLTLGTETTGSIVAPAAANGVAGMRPSEGVVEGGLIAPILPALDGAGPIAPRVADLQVALEAIAARSIGPVPRGVSLNGVRFGVPIVAGMNIGAAAGAPFDAAVAALEAAGATVFAVPVPDAAAVALAGSQRTLFAGGMRDAVDAWLTDTRAPFASLADIVAWNAAAPAERMPYGQDLLVRAVEAGATSAEHAALLEDYRATALGTITDLAARHSLDAVLSVDNLFALFYAGAGVAAITVPIGRDAAGQPHGATLVAVEPDADAALLGLAAAVERVAGRAGAPVLIGSPRPATPVAS